MKRIKVFLSLLLVMAMFFTACTKAGDNSVSVNTVSGEDTESSSPEETTINIRVCNEVRNIDKVMEVFYDKVKDDPVLSKIKVNITYVEGADYADKLNLAITAEEDYDLMFVGSWHGLSDKINDGVFKDLSSYFNNDAYPGLKSAFSEDYLSANTFNDSTYAIPLAESYEDVQGLIYREDLREKYNLPEIVDYDTFQQYLEGISGHLDEEGMTCAFGISNVGGFKKFLETDYAGRRENVFKMDYGTYNLGANFYAAFNEDGTKVVNAAVAGDDASYFSGFPEGFNTDFASERYSQLNDWTKYVNSDALMDSSDDTANFDAGMTGAVYATATEWLTHSKNIAAVNPDAKVGFFIMDDAQRNFEPGAIVSKMQAWNFLCVPVWSEKTDAVMAFLDWMWSSKENHDLFQYGLEGEDWEAIGDNAYKVLNSESYVMPGYSFCWNPTFIRYDEDVVNDEYATKVYDYMYNSDSYTLSPLAGFNFDKTKVESQIATITTYSDDYKFEWAAYGDETAAKIKEYHDACEKAGLEDVRTELINQLQTFLDEKNK